MAVFTPFDLNQNQNLLWTRTDLPSKKKIWFSSFLVSKHFEWFGDLDQLWEVMIGH